MVRQQLLRALALLALAFPSHALVAQDRAAAPPVTAASEVLDSLVQMALAANPEVSAAAARVRAAAAALPQAGARPDPMLMAGLVNFPITDPGFDDFMTMKMVGVSQVFPFPGKLGLRTRAARHELAAAEAELVATRLETIRQVKDAYYELVQADRLLEIVERNQRLLVGLMQATEASYRVGRSGQEDVLGARVEATRLGENAAALHEARRAALARLNAVLDRPSEAPVPAPAISAPIMRAALADSASRIRFVSATLGARAADSPLPPLDSLQALAVQRSPTLEAHEAMIAAQEARVASARKDALPDFDVSLEYGQRAGFPDMVTATVSIPIPLQKGRKQNQAVAEAEAELSSEVAGHHARLNQLRARVAELVSDLERDRAQLALYAKAVLPQARAALEAATTGFQVGRTTFQTLVERQATLFNYETEYVRALTDFARSLAALEQTVGQEVLR
ncbi:MAG: TolC family protein [Brachybacterium paraconglomeratum]|nr:TolC family protein [Brachybacterium paraconglomeratum]